MRARAGTTSPEALLDATLAWLVAFLASAVLCHHLCLLLGLPASRVVWFWLPPLLALTWKLHRRGLPRLPQAPAERRFLVGVLVASGLAAVASSLMGRADADDLQLLHRSLLQLRHREAPFITTEEIFDVGGLPLAAAGWLPSFAPVTALVADSLGLDPLQVFHNVVPFVGSSIWVVVMVLVYRHLGLAPRAALLAVAGAWAFLMIDGNLHRSFGSMMLSRLWQGKALLWTICFPLGLHWALRYLEEGRTVRLGSLLMLSIVAGGLSGTGLFLFPALLLAVGPAYIVARGLTRTLAVRLVLLNLSSSYSLLLLSGMALGLLANYDIGSTYVDWPQDWFESLSLVVAGPPELVRDGFLLLVLPGLCLKRPMGTLLVALTAVIGALYLSPWSGPHLLGLLSAGAYWRLLYLLPLPVCAGLLLAVEPRDRGAWPGGAAVGQLAGWVLVLAACRFTALDSRPGRPAWQKAPLEYRFQPLALQFSKATVAQVRGRRLLAPEEIVGVIPLLDPLLRVEATRREHTLRIFGTAGHALEGQRRVTAQRLVTTCRIYPRARRALVASLLDGVDAIVIGPCGGQPGGRAAVEAILARHGDWREAHTDGGYTLLLRGGSPVGASHRLRVGSGRSVI